MKWSRAVKIDDEYCSYKYYASDALTDWAIEKREDTIKPYVLIEICTGRRHGAFNKLGSAKQAAILHDYG